MIVNFCRLVVAVLPRFELLCWLANRAVLHAVPTSLIAWQVG